MKLNMTFNIRKERGKTCNRYKVTRKKLKNNQKASEIIAINDTSAKCSITT